MRLDDAPDHEVEAIEAELIDHVTAAKTVAQLADEIAILRELERQAQRVLRGGKDSKWLQLLSLLQDTPEMKNADGTGRKLVIFTEHRDTLDYLTDKLNTVIGRPEAVVTISGGTHRDQRRNIEERFRHAADVQILVATDAAGEGINLQSAHLMVNYDLPWNPNRLEQRFGRIHRIGQKEVCHLWNLVAGETREGAVYQRLLEKLARERDTLNGQVFDVLGELFARRHCEGCWSKRCATVTNKKCATSSRLRSTMSPTKSALRRSCVMTCLSAESWTRARLSKSAPTWSAPMPASCSRTSSKPFLSKLFKSSGERCTNAKAGATPSTTCPLPIRNRAKERGLGPISPRYTRICFDKEQIHHDSKPEAAFVCPGARCSMRPSA